MTQGVLQLTAPVGVHVCQSACLLLFSVGVEGEEV